jgi:hypothetical protein
VSDSRKNPAGEFRAHRALIDQRISRSAEERIGLRHWRSSRRDRKQETQLWDDPIGAQTRATGQTPADASEALSPRGPTHATGDHGCNQ